MGAGTWLVAPDPAPHSRLPEVTRLAPDCPGAEEVVVGSSRAAADLAPDVRGTAPGFPGAAVASLTLAGSSLPTGVGMVEHGVYGRGCRPALVLVHGALPALTVAGQPPAPSGACLDRPGGVRAAGYYADGKHLLPAGAVLNSRQVAAALARPRAWAWRSGERGIPAAAR